MTDFGRPYRQIGDVSRAMLDDAAQVAKDASKRIDDETYTASALIDTMTKLADIAVKGGSQLVSRARAAAPESVPEGPMIVADHMTSVARRLVGQLGEIAKEASDQMQVGVFRNDEFVRSLTKVVDVTVVGGVELAQTALFGPAYASTTFRSDAFHAAKAADVPRKLRIDPDAPISRQGDGKPIPAGRIRIDPPELPPGETQFVFVVNEDDLPSGVYVGTVLVTNPENASEPEKVEVAIRL